MDEFRARISRVRMKSGTDVRVLHNSVRAPSEIERTARGIIEQEEGSSKLTGFVMIGLFSDGTAATSFKIPEGMGLSMAVGWMMEVLRRDILIRSEAASVFDSQFE